MIPILKKRVDTRCYKFYVLFILTFGYLLSILGHFLLGVTSRAVAKDLHYGDKACLYKNPAKDRGNPDKMICITIKDEVTCEKNEHCQWDWSGLGLAYQILAGPSYVAVYTTAGVLFGIFGDRFNRVRLVIAAVLVLGLAVVAMGTATKYWHLVVLRVILAAGEAATSINGSGILSDMFRGTERALVMAMFGWGLYGGYGAAFPIGRYVPEANLWGLGWRPCFYFTGGLAVVVGVVIALTVQQPERTVIGEERRDMEEGKEKTKNPWLFLVEPRILLLCLASSIRQVGGITLACNCNLFFTTYYPEYDLGWILFCIIVILGSGGVLIGGFVSDKFVTFMGVRGRVLVIASSQMISSPFAFATCYLSPVGAMITLAVAYMFAEMWCGILIATLVELVPLAVRSTTVGIFVFVMDNVGGNVPVLVDPVSKSVGYREAMYIFYGGFFFIGSIIFFGTVFLMPGKRKTASEIQAEVKDK